MMKCTMRFFETPCTPKALQKSLVHFKRDKAKLQWKILWLWKVWALQYFKPISSMKNHFNKDNFPKLSKFSKFSSQILTKRMLIDSSVSKDTICKISVPDLERLWYAELFLISNGLVGDKHILFFVLPSPSKYHRHKIFLPIISPDYTITITV
jgi:hypothetical protein